MAKVVVNTGDLDLLLQVIPMQPNAILPAQAWPAFRRLAAAVERGERAGLHTEKSDHAALLRDKAAIADAWSADD